MIRNRLLAALALPLLMLALPTAAQAAGFRFRGAAASTQLTLDQKGYFDGKDYEISIYASPLFGFESNYKVAGGNENARNSAIEANAADPPPNPLIPVPPESKAEGSLALAVNGGAEFKYRPSNKIFLRAELSAGALLPLKDTSLTGFLFELPVFFTYRLGRQWELFLSNHVAFERARTPPVFLDIQQTGAASGQALISLSVYEQVRPAVVFRPIPGLSLDAGPYLRIKQVNFSKNLPDTDPDYRLFDLGGDLALTYRPLRYLSLRLHYDFAARSYSNVKSRPAQGLPATDDALRALRHYVDLRLRANYRWLSGFAGYGFRYNVDNAGAFDYNEHHVFAGLGFRYKTRFSISGQVFAALRNYTNRTPCEAFRSEKPGLNFGKYVGADCRDPDHPDPKDPDFVAPSAQNSRESLIGVRVEAAYSFADWFQLLLSYELEDSGARTDAPAKDARGKPTFVDDPQFANHRIMGGLSFSL